MLLTGTYSRSLDDKQRLPLPKQVREALGHPQVAVLVATPGTDGSLALYTEESFAQLGRQLSSASPVGPEVRAFSRLFYGQAERLEIDGQGRIRIPAGLVTFAGLKREAVLVGVRDHLELWDSERWKEYLSGTQPRFDEIAEKAFETRS